MRGRKPTPSHLRVIAGNPGRRPINPDEPKPKAELPDEAPAFLSDRQKEIYRQARASAPAGLLGDLDESIFVRWVVAYDAFQQYNDQVLAYGLWVKGKGGGHAPNPAIAQREKMGKAMHQAAAELGFTPSARSRVKIDPNAGKTKNPFSDLRAFGEED